MLGVGLNDPYRAPDQRTIRRGDGAILLLRLSHLSVLQVRLSHGPATIHPALPLRPETADRKEAMKPLLALSLLLLAATLEGATGPPRMPIVRAPAPVFDMCRISVFFCPNLIPPLTTIPLPTTNRVRNHVVMPRAVK